MKFENVTTIETNVGVIPGQLEVFEVRELSLDHPRKQRRSTLPNKHKLEDHNNVIQARRTRRTQQRCERAACENAPYELVEANTNLRNVFLLSRTSRILKDKQLWLSR